MYISREVNFLEILNSLSYMLSKLPLFLEGAKVTIILTAVSMVLGTLLGLAGAICKVVHNKLLNVIGYAYTWVFRGIPLLVQIYIIYYGLPGIGIELNAWTSSILAFSLCAGAYITEYIRGAILSIDKGQMEASLSIGMTYGQAMRRIIIPQTYRRLLPPLANEFITLLKDTSLVAVIAMVEILRHGQLIAAADFRPFEMYIEAGLVYLSLTTVASIFAYYLEKRLAARE